MRVQVASDLHLEFLESRFHGFRVVEPTKADVLLLAGDIHSGNRVLEAFSDWPIPVVAIRGNHEHYGSVLEDVISGDTKPTAAGSVRIVECERLELGPARLLACTLWTDYALYGNVPAAMDTADRLLLDHRRIRTRTPDGGEGRFTPDHARIRNADAVDWLSRELSRSHPGPTIVCTHHAPHQGSIDERYRDHPSNPAFVSDLSHLMPQVDLWIHGHVHASFDYRVGRTRVVANPRGYALNKQLVTNPAALRWENPRFDPSLVIEI